MSLEEHKKIRVLVVEDSRVAAEFLTYLLNSDHRMQVIGVAADGEEALVATQRMKPDVITMDIHMPKANGFEATRKIMETCPTPIVIVSGSLSSDAVANNFRAIESGALAVVARPEGVGHADYHTAAKELVDTVKLMSEVKVVKRWPRTKANASSQPILSVDLDNVPHRQLQAVAIGASTGGPVVLQTLLARLPKDFALPVLIVQHMAPGFAQGFVEWLADSTHYLIRLAVHGESLLPGHAYVAPDDFHLGVQIGNRILLSKDAKENGLRPSVGFLFRSVERVFGSGVVAVLLTGMGKDGAQELKELKDAGAITIAQDETSSVVHGMPGEAIKIGAAKHILPPEAIANTLTTIAAKP
jgi:two-component system chemotaxis response regulator CheB